MNIAVCFAGLVRGNVDKNIKAAKAQFGDNIYFATWEKFKDKKSEELNCSYWDEPVLDYNPWSECVEDSPHPKYLGYKKIYKKDPGYRPKFLNATKQLIAHAYQLQYQVPKKYDIIIRTRYDTTISTKVDFSKYINYVSENKASVGFAIRGRRHSDIHSFKEIDKRYPKAGENNYSHDWGWWINDNLLIHHRSRFDSQKVHDYHKTKKLLPAEFGWYQILSEGKDDHLSVYGGAALDRYA